MFKNIIFLIFKNNYRSFALGNFGKTSTYSKFIVISLGGRLKTLIGILLYSLNIGRFISIDGNPFLKNKKNSINVWFTGTTLKILNDYRTYENNFVNMNNSIVVKEKKIFQIYPIIKEKKNFFKKPKIIFMGKVFFKPDNILIENIFLHSQKNNFLNDFSLIDHENFWVKDKKKYEKEFIFEKYRIIKTYLREQIILKISKNFKNNFYIYGEDFKDIGISFLDPVYENKKVKQIYEGNICLDTGSILGSLSLHPRSIQIIESNGVLVQTKQKDSEQIWGNIQDKIVSNNLNELLNKIDLMLSNQNYLNENLDLIYEEFKKSEHKIFETLSKAFKL